MSCHSKRPGVKRYCIYSTTCQRQKDGDGDLHPHTRTWYPSLGTHICRPPHCTMSLCTIHCPSQSSCENGTSMPFFSRWKNSRWRRVNFLPNITPQVKAELEFLRSHAWCQSPHWFYSGSCLQKREDHNQPPGRITLYIRPRGVWKALGRFGCWLQSWKTSRSHVAQLVGHRLAKRKVGGLTAVRGAVRSGQGAYRRQSIDISLSLIVSLPLFLPPFPSL